MEVCVRLARVEGRGGQGRGFLRVCGAAGARYFCEKGVGVDLSRLE